MEVGGANWGLPRGSAASGAAGLSFSERRTWAIRQGNPLWLWPEVAPSEWRSAVLHVEKASTAILNGHRRCSLSADPAAIGLAGYTSGMGPLLGWWIERELLSVCGETERILRNQLDANGIRMARMLGEAQVLTRLFLERGVEVTILKGAHTGLAYFPAPACRPMSDLDLLIEPGDSATAEAVLETAGYRRVARTSLETTWCAEEDRNPVTATSLEADDPWTVDLHVSLDVPGPPGAATARLSALGSRRVSTDLFAAAKVLGQPALLLHLASHAGSGFHNLTLLRLVEIVLVARADCASGALHWDEFCRAGRATGSLAFAYPALALAHRLSPDDIPEAVVDRCKAETPSAIRRLVAAMRPATAHRIQSPSIREHYAWTKGASGWLRRLAADIVPEPRSFWTSVAIHAARARGLLRSALQD